MEQTRAVLSHSSHQVTVIPKTSNDTNPGKELFGDKWFLSRHHGSLGKARQASGCPEKSQSVRSVCYSHHVPLRKNRGEGAVPRLQTFSALASSARAAKRQCCEQGICPPDDLIVLWKLCLFASLHRFRASWQKSPNLQGFEKLAEKVKTGFAQVQPIFSRPLRYPKTDPQRAK